MSLIINSGLFTLFVLLVNVFAVRTQTTLQYELSEPRGAVATASVGQYGLFCGGFWQQTDDKGQNSTYSSTVDIFNHQTRNWTTSQWTVPRSGALGTSTGKFALFVGGNNMTHTYPLIEIWNSETKEWTKKELSLPRSGVGTTSIGRYALFAGGLNGTVPTSRVDIFNSENEEWTTTELSEARNSPVGVTVGPYALIACGSTSYNLSSVVDLFHSDTLQMTSMSFPMPRPGMGVTSIGPLAMFACGSNRTYPSLALDRVDIWNYQTNQWSVEKLSYPRFLPSATSNGKFAFFGSGSRDYRILNMDIYNHETKEWFTFDLSSLRLRPIGVPVGPFVLYAGGISNVTRLSSSRVDVFQLCNTSSDCLDDGLFCTDSVCINGLCDFSLDHCRNNGECNNTCNEQAKNCLTALGSTCGDSWCAGKLCDGAGLCSYSKPRCDYNSSTSLTCQLCDSERESCFRIEGEDCLLTGGIAGKCDDLGHCTDRIISEKKSSKTGLIVGVVIGVAAFLCIIAAIVFILQRRNRRRDGINSNHIELTSTLSGIVIDYKLGGGNFGEVYKGTWNGTTTVALKKLKDQAQLKEFEQEASMLQSLQHPNIVRYLGIYKASDGILYIVTEYISEGSLLSVIHEHKREFNNSNLTSFAAQAASGMAYLGSKGIIHRDLSLRNLLASKRDSSQQKYQVYVSDFGLSRVAEGGYYRSSENNIPVKWSAPEAIEYGFFTVKSDIWSFGILLWELFSGGKQPYPGISNSELLDKLNTGYRLCQPDGCPDQIYQLMQDCWKKNPDERPSFQEAFFILSNGEETTASNSLPQMDSDGEMYMAI